MKKKNDTQEEFITALMNERQELVKCKLELLEAVRYANMQLNNAFGVEYILGDLSHLHTKLSLLISKYDS